MNNGCPHLAFNIVANHRQVLLYEALLPVFFTSDKDRDAIDKTNFGLEYLLYIPLGGSFRADRQVVDHNVRFGLPQNFHNVIRLTGSFFDHT